MKFLKKTAAAAIISALMLLPSSAYADGISVILNDRPLSCDIAPVLDDGVLYIQAKPVISSLGFSVGWDNDEKKITACTSTDMIEAKIGNKTVLINGHEYELETAPVNIMNRVFVSEEFLIKMFGMKASWDPSSMTEYITTFDYTPSDAQNETVSQPIPDFDSVFSRFTSIAEPEDQSKAFDIMMEVDINKLKSMSDDPEAAKAYLKEALSPEMYEEAVALSEKYKDLIQ